MKAIVCVILLICHVSALELSLEQALGRMEAGNQSLKAGQARVEASQYSQKASLGNFLPVVKLELIAEHLDRDLVLDLDPIREAMLQMQSSNAVTQQAFQNHMQGGTPYTTSQQQAIQQGAYQQLDEAVPHFLDTIKHQNHWLGNITVYQPLFHGGKIYAANRIFQSKTKVATQEQVRKIADLRRDFSKLYLQATILRTSISLRQNALLAMESHRQRAQTLVEQGMVDRTALLRAQIALADGRTALADDQMKLNSIGLTLAQYMDAQESIYPSDTILELPPKIAKLDSYLQNIRSAHPLITTMQAQVDLSNRVIAVKNADFVPEIGAFGKYELNQSELSSLEPNWVVGVKGSVTLFRGGSDYYQRESALASKREVQWMKADVMRSLEAQFERQHLVMEQSRLRYYNLGAQEELAQENHRFTLRRFEEGQGTGLEVVDAWLQLQKVQLERVASAGDAWNALLELQWACGRTSEFVEMWQEGNTK